MATSNSPVSICNQALGHLGEVQIGSLTEGTVAAGLCQLNYDQARRGLLRRFPWQFARARALLELSATTPPFEWDYSHALPADFIRLRFLYDGYERQVRQFALEGGCVLSDYETLYLSYIFDAQDTTTYDDLFVDALALVLAARLAVPLTGDPNRRQALTSELEQLTLPLAQQLGAYEDQSAENSPLMALIDSSELVQLHEYQSDAG